MEPAKAAYAVDRLFERFTLRWPKTFLRDYEGLDIGLVKAEWRADLEGMSPDQVTYAFEALKDQTFPPSLPTFLAYCKAAPPKPVAALPNKFTEEQLAENRAAIARIRETLAAAKKMPVV
jgi:RecB family exonuclease